MSQARYFRKLWLTGAEDISKSGLLGLKKTLSAEQSSLYEIDISSNEEKQVLLFYSSDELKKAVTKDFLDYSICCFQSVRSLSKVKEVRNLSWGLIQLYYASFYAAHAILRLSGKYFINLGTEVQLSINRSSPNRPHDFRSGTFQADVDIYNKNIEFRELKGARSHESLWKIFCEYLDSIILSIKENKDDLREFQDLLEQLECLKFFLYKNGGGPFLSEFRNVVSYLNDLGYWHPSHGPKNGLERFDEKVGWWKCNIDEFQLHKSEKDEFLIFLKCTHFLVALCRQIAEESLKVTNNVKNRNFCSHGLIPYLKSF